jgi:phage-related minor tail protein
LEQLQYDQAKRRGSTLNPMFQQANELQMQLANKALNPQSDQAKQLQADLSRVNSEIQKMSTALTFVESKEIAWQKNRAGAEAFANVLNGVGNTVTNVFASLVTGTDSWANSLMNVFNIFTNLLLQAGLSSLAGTDGRGLFSILNGTFGRKAANGAYFSNGIAAFGRGGMFANNIVSSPTLFKFANGGAMKTGVMGEAGPEAIMPLTRGPGGRLGVESYGGGGGVSVVVNVDASGSKVQGDDARGKELGRVVSVAVQQEIIKQKRPGGLLA